MSQYQIAERPNVTSITCEGKWIVVPGFIGTSGGATNSTTVTILENPILNITQDYFYAEQAPSSRKYNSKLLR